MSVSLDVSSQQLILLILLNFIKFGGGGGQGFLYIKHYQVNYAVYRPSIWQHLLHLKSATELYIFFKVGHTKIGMLE